MLGKLISFGLFSITLVSACADKDPTPELSELEVELVEYSEGIVDLKGEFFVYDANSDFVAIDLFYRLSPTGELITIGQLALEGFRNDQFGRGEFNIRFEVEGMSDELILVVVGLDEAGHASEPVEAAVDLQ